MIINKLILNNNFLSLIIYSKFAKTRIWIGRKYNPILSKNVDNSGLVNIKMNNNKLIILTKNQNFE